MLHTEILPGWFLPLLAAGAILAVLLWLGLALRRSAGRKRRQDQRRRSIAFARTWDWVMGRRRTLRLTDQRSKRD